MSSMSSIDSFAAAKEATRTTIGDLQGMHGQAISELDEVVHALCSRIDPIRVRRELGVPTLAESPGGINESSPVGAEIIGQTARVQDITRYVRGVLSEIEF